MTLLFTALELLAYLTYRQFSVMPLEIVLHVALNLGLFWLVARAFQQTPRVAFSLAYGILLLSILAYFVSYETEELLGTPLRARAGIKQLQRDPAVAKLLLGYFFDHHVGICFALLGSAFAGIALHRLARLIPIVSGPMTSVTCGLALGILFFSGIAEPKSLRYDTRLTFFLDWPTRLAPRGLDRHADEIDARDDALRVAYRGTPTQAPTIVLLFADSLRADHFPQYGYDRETAPFLTKLWRQGKLQKIEWSFSTCADSFCGITTTFASRRFIDVSEKSLKFHELLSKAGYENWGFVTGDHDAFHSLGAFYERTFDHFYDSSDTPQFSLNDDAVTEWNLRNIPRVGGRPRFFYFFLMSSHVMGRRPEQMNIFQPSDIRPFLLKWHTRDFRSRLASLGLDADWADVTLRNNYDNGIRATDAQIHNVFQRLSEQGYLDDALVIILGDHGESLGEHNHLGHTLRLYNEDIQIPMFVYDTSGREMRNLFFATQQDVAPTILERVGLPVPDFYAGFSLYSSEREFSAHQIEHGRAPCYASLAKETSADARKLFKYYRCRDGDYSVEEVFELTSDPRELNNLLNEVPIDLLGTLRKRVSDLTRFSSSTKK